MAHTTASIADHYQRRLESLRAEIASDARDHARRCMEIAALAERGERLPASLPRVNFDTAVGEARALMEILAALKTAT